MQRFALLFAAFAVSLALGCGRSPLVGTWTGTAQLTPGKADQGLLGMWKAMMGPMVNGPSSLALTPDGKGFLKISSVFPERPITWSQEGDRLILHDRDAGRRPTEKKAGENGVSVDASTIVGTLSKDRKSLTLDLGPLQANLQKQPDSGSGPVTSH